MPVDYEYGPENVLIITIEGKYTFAEKISLDKKALDDERSSEGVNILFDVRDPDEKRTLEEFREIATLVNNHPNFKGKCAVVIDKAIPMKMGLARQHQALFELYGGKMELFTDRQDAMNWLSRDQE